MSSKVHNHMLEIKPEEVIFTNVRLNQTYQQIITITNPLTFPIKFEIIASDNELYEVKPNQINLKSLQSIDVQIILRCHRPLKNKIKVNSMKQVVNGHQDVITIRSDFFQQKVFCLAYMWAENPKVPPELSGPTSILDENLLLQGHNVNNTNNLNDNNINTKQQLQITKEKLKTTEDILNNTQIELEQLRSKYLTQLPGHKDIIEEALKQHHLDTEKRSLRVLEVLKAKDKIINDLNNTIQSNENTIVTLKENMSKMQHETKNDTLKKLESLKNELNIKEKLIKTLKENENELKTENMELKQQLDKSKQIYKEELNRACKKFDDAFELQGNENDINNDAITIEKQRGKIGELQIEVASLRASLRIAKSESKASINEEIKDNALDSSAMAQLRRQLDLLNQELEQKNDILLKTNQENMNLKNNIVELETLQNTAQRTVLDVERKLEETLQELKQTKLAQHESNHSVTQLTATVEQLKYELNQNNENNDVNSIRNRLQQQLDEQIIKVSKLKEEKIEQQQSFHHERLQLQQELITLKKQVNDYEQIIDDDKVKHSLQKKCLEDTVNALSVRSDIHKQLVKSRNLITVLELECKQLEQKNKMFAMNEQKLKSRLRSQEQLCSELNIKLERIKLEIEQAPDKKECIEFQQTLVRLANDVDNYRQQLIKQTNNENKDDNQSQQNTNEMMETLKNKCDEFEIEKTLLKQKLNEIENLWANEIKKVSELENRIIELNGDSTVSMSSITTKHLEQINELHSQISSKSRQIITQKNNIDSLKREINEINTKLRQINREKLQLEENNRSKIESLRSKHVTLIERCNELQEEVAVLRGKNSEKQDQMNILLQTIEGLQNSSPARFHSKNDRKENINTKLNFDVSDSPSTPKPRDQPKKQPEPTPIKDNNDTLSQSTFSTPPSQHGIESILSNDNNTNNIISTTTPNIIDANAAQKLLILSAQLCASKSSEATMARQVYRLQQDLARHQHTESELKSKNLSLKEEKSNISVALSKSEDNIIQIEEKYKILQDEIVMKDNNVLELKNDLDSNRKLLQKYKQQIEFLSNELSRTREQHHNELVKERTSQLAQLSNINRNRSSSNSINSSLSNTQQIQPTKNLVESLEKLASSNLDGNFKFSKFKQIVLNNDLEVQRLNNELQKYRWTIDYMMRNWTQTQKDRHRINEELRQLQNEREVDKWMNIESEHLLQYQAQQKISFLQNRLDMIERQSKKWYEESKVLALKYEQCMSAKKLVDNELKRIEQENMLAKDEFQSQLFKAKVLAKNELLNNIRERNRDIKEYFNTQLKQLLLSPPFYDRNIPNESHTTAMSISSCLKLNQSIAGLKIIENELLNRLDSIRSENEHLIQSLQQRDHLINKLEERANQLAIQINNKKNIDDKDPNSIMYMNEEHVALGQEAITLRLENEELRLIIKRLQRGEQRLPTNLASIIKTPILSSSHNSSIEELYNKVVTLTNDLTIKSKQLEENQNELNNYKQTHEDLMSRLEDWENNSKVGNIKKRSKSKIKSSRLPISQSQNNITTSISTKTNISKLLVQYRMNVSKLENECKQAHESELKLLKVVEEQAQELLKLRKQMKQWKKVSQNKVSKKKKSHDEKNRKLSDFDISNSMVLSTIPIDMTLLSLKEENAKLKAENFYLQQKRINNKTNNLRKVSSTSKTTNQSTTQLQKEIKKMQKREVDLKRTIVKLTKFQSNINQLSQSSISSSSNLTHHVLDSKQNLMDNSVDNKDNDIEEEPDDPLSKAILGLSRNLNEQMNRCIELENIIDNLENKLNNDNDSNELVEEQKQIINKLNAKIEILLNSQNDNSTSNDQKQWINDIRGIVQTLNAHYSAWYPLKRPKYTSSSDENYNTHYQDDESSDFETDHIENENGSLINYLNEYCYHIKQRLKTLTRNMKHLQNVDGVNDKLKELQKSNTEESKMFALFIENSQNITNNVYREGKRLQKVIKNILKRLKSSNVGVDFDEQTKMLVYDTNLNRDYEAEIADLRKEINVLSREDMNGKNAIDLIRQCLSILNDNIPPPLKNETNSNSALFEYVSLLFQDVHKLNSNYKSILSEFETNQDELKITNEENYKLKNDVSKQSNTINQLNSQINKLDDRIDEINIKLKQTIIEKNDMKIKCTKLNSNEDTLKVTVIEQENKIKEISDKMTKLNLSNTELQNELTTVQNKLNNVEIKHKKLCTESTEDKQENVNLQNKIKILTHEYESFKENAEININRLQNEFKQTSDSLIEKENENSKLFNDIHNYKELIQFKENELKQLKDHQNNYEKSFHEELEQAQISHKSVADMYERQLKALRKQLKSEIQKCTELYKQNKHLSKKSKKHSNLKTHQTITSKSSDYDLFERITNLLSDLANRDATISKLTNDLLELKNSLKAMNDNNNNNNNNNNFSNSNSNKEHKVNKKKVTKSKRKHVNKLNSSKSSESETIIPNDQRLEKKDVINDAVDNAKLHSFEMKIALAEREKVLYKSQCETLQSELNSVMEKNDVFEDEIKQLKKKLSQSVNDYEEKLENMGGKMGNVDSIRNERTQLKDEHKKMNEIIAQHKQTVKTAREELQRKNQLIDTYKTKMSDMESELDEIKCNITKKEKTITNLKKKLAKTSRQEERKETIRVSHKTCEEKLKSTIQKWRNTVKNLNNENENKSRYISELKKKLDNVQEIKDKNTSHNERHCNDTIKRLKNDINRKINHINVLKEKITSLEELNQQYCDENHELEGKIRTIQSRLHDARSKLNVLKDITNNKNEEELQAKCYKTHLSLVKKVILNLCCILCDGVINNKKKNLETNYETAPLSDVSQLSNISTMSNALQQFSVIELNDIMNTHTKRIAQPKRLKWNGIVPLPPKRATKLYDIYIGINDCVEDLQNCIDHQSGMITNGAEETTHTILKAMMKLIEEFVGIA